MKRVAVIDYGMGNLHSVAKAVEHAGREAGITVDVSITADAAAIAAADRYDMAMILTGRRRFLH